MADLIETRAAGGWYQLVKTRLLLRANHLGKPHDIYSLSLHTPYHTKIEF